MGERMIPTGEDKTREALTEFVEGPIMSAIINAIRKDNGEQLEKGKAQPVKKRPIAYVAHLRKS